MSGSRVAQKVQRGLAKAAVRVGSGSFVCALQRAITDEPDVLNEAERPWDRRPADPLALGQLYALNALQLSQQRRDAAGVPVVAAGRRALLVDATGVVPQRTDTVAVGVAPDDVDHSTKFSEVLVVSPIAPGGTPIMFQLELGD